VQVSEEFFDLTRYAVRSWRRYGGSVDVPWPAHQSVGFREGQPDGLLGRNYSKPRAGGCNKLSLDGACERCGFSARDATRF